MAKKKTALGKVGAAIADAASAVVKSADKHVVHPVGEALGLLEKKKPKFVPAKRPAKKIAVAKKPSPLAVRAEAKKSSVTKAEVKKVMTSAIATNKSKPSAKKPTPNSPVKK